MRAAFLSALRACNFYLGDPGAARFALAPGYLLTAPSALRSRASRDAFRAPVTHISPRLRRSGRAHLAAPSALPVR